MATPYPVAPPASTSGEVLSPRRGALVAAGYVRVVHLAVAVLFGLLGMGVGCDESGGDGGSSSAEASADSVAAGSFRQERIEGSNGFKSHEIFRTSTEGSTGYDAYVTWNAERIFFGYTGQDVGEPACTPETSASCPVYERGESETKWLVYFVDADPLGDAGTEAGEGPDGVRWTLPFRADYAIHIRSDYATSGQASLLRYDGGWQETSDSIEVADNDGSKFLEFGVDRSALGEACAIQTVAGFVDTADGGASYALWPQNAVPDADSAGVVQGTSATFEHAYGFVLIDGQTPNASDGQANLDRPFPAGFTCAAVNGNSPEGTAEGAARPYHSIGFTTSNDFSGQEIFSTSTEAATGYDAYVTWDATNLYFGMTGSDVGPGDCVEASPSRRSQAARSGRAPTAAGASGSEAAASGPSQGRAGNTDAQGEAQSGSARGACAPYETGQSPSKWVVYYLDIDPTTTEGTTRGDAHGGPVWTLPFRADYAVMVRSDGVTDERGYTGVADLRAWEGGAWVSRGAGAFEIFDNSTSGFLKLSVTRDLIDAPDMLRVVGGFVDTEAGQSYAFWPETAGDSLATGPVTLRADYGFDLTFGQIPNASGGLANLDRPFFGRYSCASRLFSDGDPDSGSGSRPFHSLPINGSNSFNTEREAFATSTEAATGYAAYATWDRARLYLGMTGSNVGSGDCQLGDGGCTTAETGQSTDTWLVYYLDVDPLTGRGTRTAWTDADTLGTRQSWTLPFPADYAVIIRTDGQTAPFGHTGVVEVKQWSGGRWVSRGPCAVTVWDNNGSGYLELGLDLSEIGNPHQVRVAGWMFGPDRSYAYWPADAASDGPARGTRLSSWWGFELRDGVQPNAPDNERRRFTAGAPDQVTFNSYRVDGRRDPNEQLPGESLGRENTQAAPGPANPELFLTWDDRNVYLSLTGGPLADGSSDLFLVIDADPAIGKDPRSGHGRSDPPVPADSVGGAAIYPFAADVAFRFAGRDGPDDGVQSPAPGRRYVARDSAWTSGAHPAGTQIVRRGADGVTEVAVPWSAIRGVGARDTSAFHLVAYLVDDGNGVDAQWPAENPNGTDVEFPYFFSYTVAEDIPRGVEPFARASRSVRETGGVTLDDATYANVYLVPSSQQTATLGGHTTVIGELLVGENATLDVGTHPRDPTGANRLRIGRRMTVLGEVNPHEGVVVTFDPAEGYPDRIEPGGGFAVPNSPTVLAGQFTLYGLTLHNRTELGAPRVDGTRVEVRGPLVTAVGGQLVGLDRLVRPSRRDSTQSDSTRRVASARPDSRADTAATASDSTRSVWSRIAGWLRRDHSTSDSTATASGPTASGASGSTAADSNASDSTASPSLWDRMAGWLRGGSDSDSTATEASPPSADGAPSADSARVAHAAPDSSASATPSDSTGSRSLWDRMTGWFRRDSGGEARRDTTGQSSSTAATAVVAPLWAPLP